MSNKKKIIIISALGILILLSVLFIRIGNRIKPNTIEDVKECLTQCDYYDEQNMKSFDVEGYLSFGGLTKNHWSFFFYDYGKDKQGMDETVSLLISPIEISSESKKNNCTIYESENDINYALFVRVDNTFLVISGRKEDREDVRNLARKIGYYQ